MGYPLSMKQAVIRKVRTGNQTQDQIAKEAGIGRSTLTYWLKHYKTNGENKLSRQEKRPCDWSGPERIDALMTTGRMSDEERLRWCRENGLFAHNLDQWKKEAICSLVVKTPANKGDQDSRRLKKELSALKKELARKDKALAETAALLVLKKKADSIWGAEGDD